MKSLSATDTLLIPTQNRKHLTVRHGNEDPLHEIGGIPLHVLNIPSSDIHHGSTFLYHST